MPSLVSIIAVLVMSWLISFFVILPIGLKTPEKVDTGQIEGATENAKIGRKLLVSLAIACLFTIIYLSLIHIYPQLNKIVDP
jgi:predicted secreted protein